MANGPALRAENRLEFGGSKGRNPMSTILVDQDGTIADWGFGYGAMLDSLGPVADGIPRHQDQRSFDLHEGLDSVQRNVVDRAMTEMRYIDLPVIPGAIKALRSMLDHGHDVVICTSPWLPNKLCAQDKLDWVERKLGRAWMERVIITKDKTMVKADYLIDDKPRISGRYFPEWQHVVFTQPYNREVESRLRLQSWADWKNEEY
jgi:5'-nucleotidase